MEIRLFKTSIKNKKEANKLTPLLNEILEGTNWNFDLYDREKVLRIESQSIPLTQLEKLSNDYQFELLELH